QTLCAMAATPGAITAAGSKAGPYGAAAGAAVEIALDNAHNCPVPNPTPAGAPRPPGGPPHKPPRGASLPPRRPGCEARRPGTQANRRRKRQKPPGEGRLEQHSARVERGGRLDHRALQEAVEVRLDVGERQRRLDVSVGGWLVDDDRRLGLERHLEAEVLAEVD